VEDRSNLRLERNIKIDKPEIEPEDQFLNSVENEEKKNSGNKEKIVKIYPFGINRDDLERNLRMLELPGIAVKELDEADVILTTKSKTRPGTKLMISAEDRKVPVHVIKKNASSQIMKFLKFYFHIDSDESDEELAIKEVNEAIRIVLNKGKSVDLNPQNSYIRRLQHQSVETAGLHSESVGQDPKRRLRIYPA